MPKCLVSLLIFACTCGCDSYKNDSQLNDIKKEIRESLNQAKQGIQELAPAREQITAKTDEEVRKLFIFEYKVAEFDKLIGLGELETKLNELGSDTWECFDVEQTERSLRFFCKRRPKTYLRYIPRMF